MTNTITCLVENGDARTKSQMTIEEIRAYLENGGRGMIHLNHYIINDIYYSATALSIGDETIPFVEDDKLVTPTFFQSYLLADSKSTNPYEKIKVKAITPLSDIQAITLYS